jgi:histone H3/H4
MLPKGLKEQFAAAIRRMLKPVVRQLVSYGVTYPALDEMVRELYVEVAAEGFALPHKRLTDSRVALITGLHRKEIARLRRRPPTAGAVVEVEDSVVTRVIGRWMGGPPYSDSRGRPRPLAYESSRQRAATFARLVRERGVDVPVRSVLDELIRTDVVEVLDDGDVILKQQANIPAGDLEGKLTLMASDPGEVFSTIIHNVEHPDQPWLQRKVVYDNVGSDALETLRESARATGEEFIRKSNVLLAEHDRDRNPEAAGGSRSRVVLGVYYFEESEARLSEPARKRPSLPGRITRSR